MMHDCFNEKTKQVVVHGYSCIKWAFFTYGR